MSMRLIAMIMTSTSPEEDRKIIEPSVVLMACPEWSITFVSASSWFGDNSSSCYLRCIQLYPTVLFWKINDWCLQDSKCSVWRAGHCVTKQIYEPVFIFTISQKSLKIFGNLDLVDLMIILSIRPRISFSSLNWNIFVSVSY